MKKVQSWSEPHENVRQGHSDKLQVRQRVRTISKMVSVLLDVLYFATHPIWSAGWVLWEYYKYSWSTINTTTTSRKPELRPRLWPTTYSLSPPVVQHISTFLSRNLLIFSVSNLLFCDSIFFQFSYSMLSSLKSYCIFAFTFSTFATISPVPTL